MATFDMKGYARRGAELRAAELNQELEAIYGAFPDLRKGSTAATRISPRADQEDSLALGAAEAPRRRRKWKMTAAQKKAVGERMRKYWAARKSESAGKKR